MRALQISELAGPDALRSSICPTPTRRTSWRRARAWSSTSRRRRCRFPTCSRAAASTSSSLTCRSCPAPKSRAIVRSASEGSGFEPGDRVAAFDELGGMAEGAVAPPSLTFALHDSLDYAQGAALILNYHTAYFALKLRGRLEPGEQRARARRRRRSRHRCAPGREGARREDDRRRVERRQGARRPRTRARTRSCAPTGRGASVLRS